MRKVVGTALILISSPFWAGIVALWVIAQGDPSNAWSELGFGRMLLFTAPGFAVFLIGIFVRGSDADR
ncbi:MAG: hypothetical protein AAF914_03775 [Pseudomonadota bacterium]